MAVITTGTFNKLLWPGLSRIWGLNYKEKEAVYSKLFEEKSSKKDYEEDVGLVPLGLTPIKNQGAGIEFDTMTQGYVTRYIHITYGLGFIVTEEEIEDNLYLKYGELKTKMLARSARLTKEIIAANIFNRAFNSSYTFGDGKPLIATDHPTYSSSGLTLSNQLTTPADLSEVALEQIAIQIKKAVDDRGNIIALMPKKLVIPTELIFEATRILKNPNRPATADRDINALYKMGYFNEVIENPHFTDTDAWFVITDNLQGLTYYNRRPTKFASDNEFNTGNAKFKSTFRCSFGCTDTSRAVFASPGA